MAFLMVEMMVDLMVELMVAKLVAMMVVMMVALMVVMMAVTMAVWMVEMMVHNNRFLRFSQSKHFLFLFLLYKLLYYQLLDKVYKMIHQSNLDTDPVNNVDKILQLISLLHLTKFLLDMAI
jgi:hypothetical protein